jgi:hypothetical protein
MLRWRGGGDHGVPCLARPLETSVHSGTCPSALLALPGGAQAGMTPQVDLEEEARGPQAQCNPVQHTLWHTGARNSGVVR